MIQLRNALSPNSSKRALIVNAASLYMIRGVNMLFPIVLIPLIIQRLDLASYGAYSIIVSVLNILILIMDFGFTYTATKDVAKLKSDPSKLSSYFSSVIFIQSIVFLCTLILLVALSFHPKFHSYQPLMLLCSITLAGYLLNPGWLFQGMEESHINAAINLVFRILTILVLYLFLTKERGLFFLFWIYSLGFLGWGISGFIMAVKKYQLNFSGFQRSASAVLFRSTLSVFLANLISSFYLAGIPMILNFANTSLTTIASYSVAERIIRGICTIVSPLSIAFIPYFISKTGQREDVLINKYLVIGLKISAPFLVVSLILLLGLDHVVKAIAVFKPEFTFDIMTLNNIRIQSLIVFLSVLNNIVGISTFISLGYNLAFRNIMFVVFALSGITFLLVLNAGTNYAGSIIALFSEFVLTILLVVFLRFKQRSLRTAIHT